MAPLIIFVWIVGAIVGVEHGAQTYGAAHPDAPTFIESVVGK